jgi:hypothetical protein
VNSEKYRKKCRYFASLLLSVYVMPYVLGQITKLPISVYSGGISNSRSQGSKLDKEYKGTSTSDALSLIHLSSKT